VGPADDVAASVAAGVPMDRVLAAYPSLDADTVDLAVILAEANPDLDLPTGPATHRRRAESI
jgi:hypothetical protein